MEITDAPYAAGTPEHSQWVRETFIPHENVRRTLADMASGREHCVGSAESQGRSVIVGGPYDSFDDSGNLVPDGLMAAIERSAERLFAATRPAVIIIDDTIKMAANSFQIFYEEFTGLVDVPRGKITYTPPDPHVPSPETIVARATAPVELPKCVTVKVLPEPLIPDVEFKNLPTMRAQIDHDPRPWEREPWRRG